jgi:enterochelin esterase family protein
MPDQSTPHSEAAAPTRPPPPPHSDLVSPEVLPDNRVTFRIYAPKATEVSITGEWVRQGRGTGGPLLKDEQGIWSIAAGPLVPDFYTYALTVDGVRTMDPQNTTIKPGNKRLENMFLVPGEEADFAATRPVPHGEVRTVWYDSTALGGARSMRVYTPPGYDTGDGTYPVFYLIHGGGDNDAGWTTIGRANFILDNLLAAGKIEPMIVVMPNGSVPRPAGSYRLVGADRTLPAAIKARIEAIAASHDIFVEDLLTTIIPTVEQRYRVRTDRGSRAIAGLSMGGAETLRVAPSNLDKFAYIGVFSMGLQVGAEAGVHPDFKERNADFFADPDRTNKLLKLFYIAAGENDRTITDGARRLSATLTRRGIQHMFNETTGGHTWINWRLYLYDFLQLLFRD